MVVRRVGTAALLLTVLTAAGCTSSGSKPAATSGPTSMPGAGTGSTSAASLAAKITKGLAGVTSAHLAVDAGGLGGASTGDFTFANGKATGSDLMVSAGGDQVEVVTTGGTSYAKLPAGQNTSGKPWVQVTADSKNEFVRGLAATLPLNQAVGSLDQLTAVIAGATAVRDKGAATVGGAAAHRYGLTITPAAGSSSELQGLLAQLGTKSLPVDLWLDRTGRPVRVVLSIDLAGESIPFDVTISKYDAPVTITAPPADQVSSG